MKDLKPCPCGSTDIEDDYNSVIEIGSRASQTGWLICNSCEMSVDVTCDPDVVSLPEVLRKKWNAITGKGEWRDAKTDPPEEEGVYWCYDPTEKYIQQRCYCYSPNTGFNNSSVTYWQPLPAPPK